MQKVARDLRRSVLAGIAVVGGIVSLAYVGVQSKWGAEINKLNEEAHEKLYEEITENKLRNPEYAE